MKIEGGNVGKSLQLGISFVSNFDIGINIKDLKLLLWDLVGMNHLSAWGFIIPLTWLQWIPSPLSVVGNMYLGMWGQFKHEYWLCIVFINPKITKCKVTLWMIIYTHSYIICNLFIYYYNCFVLSSKWYYPH